MISRPVATAPRALLLAIGPLGERAGPWHISNKLIERGYAVTHRHVMAGSSPVQALRAFRACHDIAQYELTAASDYSIGFAMAFAAIVRRARGRLAIAGMNLSRRPFRSGVAPLDHVINRIFGRVDLFIVHSTPEVSQFLHLHRLDAGRFTVVPWGFDLPDVAAPECALPNRPYVAVVGRNNRDFATVARALDGTGIAGVFVGCAQPLPSVDAEIIAYESLPFDQCLGIIRGSLANVIPLNDSSRGAGHITAVAGMALGGPISFPMPM
ncbi:hypothetical protein [Sphingomonas sp. CARO-RG-8B-R24-01]|uniref:hypothetical protein n=1 Tax=Sphingomonas sp. CARO-RG-8B-R24-01 TaxID=2914831 RepID=UPI001F57C49E|nr:hypothetical protein [Sphingomonas sp. CARO-RG-8B-R24-01]